MSDAPRIRNLIGTLRGDEIPIPAIRRAADDLAALLRERDALAARCAKLERLADAAIAAYLDHYSVITQYALVNATRAYLGGALPPP